MVVLFLLTGFYRTAHATGVDFERNLHLGTWSPFASYWERESPVCAWTQTQEVGFRITAYNHSPGVPSRNAYYFNQQLGCGLSPNFMLKLRVSKPDLDYAMPGIYKGSLVLMLSPI